MKSKLTSNYIDHVVKDSAMDTFEDRRGSKLTVVEETLIDKVFELYEEEAAYRQQSFSSSFRILGGIVKMVLAILGALALLKIVLL